VCFESLGAAAFVFITKAVAVGTFKIAGNSFDDDKHRKYSLFQFVALLLTYFPSYLTDLGTQEKSNRDVRGALCRQLKYNRICKVKNMKVLLSIYI